MSTQSSLTAMLPQGWDVSIKMVHEQLQLIGETQLGKEIMDDYEQLVSKLRQAIYTLQVQEKEENFADLERILGDSNLNISWLLEKVPHLMHTIGMSKVNCEVLSTDGFVSQIVRVVLADNKGASSSAIVKMPETSAIRNALIATIGPERTSRYYWPEDQEEARIHGMMDQFNREIDFYTNNDIQGLKIPSVYHCQKWEKNSTGALVMEDLCHLNSVSFFDTLTLRQVKEVCGELQLLHLYSKNMSSVWKEKFRYPRGILNLLKGLQPVVQAFVESFPQLGFLYGKLQHLYAEPKFVDYIMLQSHKDLGLPDVVCHGDLWTYNFLWHTDGNNAASESLGAIIDWQGPHLGSIGEDFAHMLVFCCSPEVRRKAEKEILPRHYEKISSLLQYYPKFTLKNFLKAYRRQLVMHSLHLAFISNVMLKYKHTSKMEKERNTTVLLERVLGAWEDAWEILQEELPEWVNATL